MIVTFGWSWGIASYAYFSGTGYGALLALCYMMGPAVGALTCALRYDRHRFFESLGLSTNPFNKWLFVAFLAPIFLVAISHLITQNFSGRSILSLADAYTVEFNKVGIDPESLPISIEKIAWLQLITAPFLAALLNTFVMILTEEVGWRGWLWDRWAQMPFWKHAIFVGIIWGVWHAPIILMGHNYPDMPIWGAIIFIAMVMLLTPIIAHIREAGGSMIHAAMFHGVFNGVAPFTIIIMADSSMPWRGVLGISGFIVLILGALLVTAHRSIQPT